MRGANALLCEADFRNTFGDESVWESGYLFGAMFSDSALNRAEFSGAYLALFTFSMLLIVPQGLTAQQDKVAALKTSLAANEKLQKQYRWVETSVVSLKGEEKSRIQKQCFYGPDGKVQKQQLTAPPAEDPCAGPLGAPPYIGIRRPVRPPRRSPPRAARRPGARRRARARRARSARTHRARPARPRKPACRNSMAFQRSR